METFGPIIPEPLRWLTLPADAEADHYRLLAYLQRVERSFRERKLYPWLDELQARLQELQELRRRRDELSATMPREITGIDLRKGELLRSALREDEILHALDAMFAYTLPELSAAWERGEDLRSNLAAAIRFEPVGLLPLYTREGYLLVHRGSEARVYGYVLSLPAMASPAPGHLVLRTHYVADYAIGITCTYEHVKADLAKRWKQLPNPAVFAFTSDMTLPAIETFVPLAKQLVYEVVAGAQDR